MKTIKCFLYSNATGKPHQTHDGQVYVFHKGSRRKVTIDDGGRILGVPKKLTKKQRIKLRRQIASGATRTF